MAKNQETWVYHPPRPPKPPVPERVKAEVRVRANDLVESVLKLKHIQPPPEDARFNYLVDISTKWYRSYFYSCARYYNPGPYALSPFFGTKFTRLAYVVHQRFHLSSTRHAGQ